MCNVGVSLHFRFCHRPHTLLEPPMVNIILYVAMLHQGGELGELVLAFDKVGISRSILFLHSSMSMEHRQW